MLNLYTTIYICLVITVYSYDGPGICPELLDEKKFENVKWKLTHIVPTYSIVGMLFELDVPHKIVASDGERMLQHSGMTWKVSGDHFVTKKHLTEESSALINNISPTRVNVRKKVDGAKLFSLIYLRMLCLF